MGSSSSIDLLNLGTLKEYQSSKIAKRYFCGQCGANVFWRGLDERPRVVDVSVGLMNAKSGSRAEEWLFWRTNKVTHQELAKNKPLVEALAKGLKRAGEKVKE